MAASICETTERSDINKNRKGGGSLAARSGLPTDQGTRKTRTTHGAAKRATAKTEADVYVPRVVTVGCLAMRRAHHRRSGRPPRTPLGGGRAGRRRARMPDEGRSGDTQK